MKTSHFLLFFLLPLLFSGDVSCPRACNSSYDHFQLVYTWPNTFCLNRRIACKYPVPQNFTLHGLWPMNKAGRYLVYCSNKEGISKALHMHERQLDTSWASLRADFPNREFWQYQLTKHGTCAQTRMNIMQYLQLIIAQNRRFNLLMTLKSKNIYPNHSSYPRSIVDAAIREGIGGNNFYISCQNYRNNYLIKEIFICLDAAGNKVISCPKSTEQRGCSWKNRLVFPSAV